MRENNVLQIYYNDNHFNKKKITVSTVKREKAKKNKTNFNKSTDKKNIFCGVYSKKNLISILDQ